MTPAMGSIDPGPTESMSIFSFSDTGISTITDGSFRSLLSVPPDIQSSSVVSESVQDFSPNTLSPPAHISPSTTRSLVLNGRIRNDPNHITAERNKPHDGPKQDPIQHCDRNRQSAQIYDSTLSQVEQSRNYRNDIRDHNILPHISASVHIHKEASKGISQ